MQATFGAYDNKLDKEYVSAIEMLRSVSRLVREEKAAAAERARLLDHSQVTAAESAPTTIPYEMQQRAFEFALPKLQKLSDKIVQSPDETITTSH